MQTDVILAPQLEAEKRKFRRRLGVIAILILLAGVLALQARPIYRAIKSWRSRQLVTQAEQYLKENKWEEASLKAQAAYQLKFDDPAAIRLIARLDSMSGHPAEAIPFWQKFLETADFTQDDRRNYASDLRRAGATDEAGAQLARLLADQPENPLNLRLAAQIAAVSQRREESVDYARRACQMDPANKESHLLLATLLAGSPEPAARDEGLSKLLLLSTDRTAVGLEALTTLAKRGDLPQEKIRELIPLLQQHPLATEGHRLLAVDAEIALQPERREALIESAIAARKGADALVLRDLGIWLNAHKEFTRTIEVIPANVAIGRKDLFLVHVDALAARGRWVDLRKILESGEVPLDAAIKELYLARCATELHDPGLADIHWKRAQFAALRSPEQLVAIATYAEKVGNSDQAEIAYRTLASSSATARPAYLALMRLLQKKQDTAALRDLLRDMVALWPKALAVRNDYDYLNLLLKKEAAQSMNIALELMAQNPLSLPHRTTLALAYLRVNQPEAALRVYNGLEVQWEKSPGSSRAVYAAVLAANGDKEKARDQIASLRFDTLRPEERELIKSLR